VVASLERDGHDRWSQAGRGAAVVAGRAVGDRGARVRRDGGGAAGATRFSTRARRRWRRDDRDATIGRLHGKLGALTMENELLAARIERLEAGSPLAARRSKR
jgi:hypothetical protein